MHIILLSIADNSDNNLVTSYRSPQVNMPQQSVSPLWVLQGTKV